MGRILHVRSLVLSNAHHLPLQSVFPDYDRRRPEATVLYKTIAENIETFFSDADCAPEKGLPQYVRQEFYEFLKCGILAHGFLRVKCEDCRHEKLVAFSCKRRGFCPSCGGRRMAETAAFLVDEIFPKVPIRQWVLSFPYPLRYLMASHPKVQSAILAITIRAITGFLRKRAKAQGATGPIDTGVVSLIQRFGGSVNLNIHFHMLILAGVYTTEEAPRFIKVPPPTDEEVRKLLQSLSVRVVKFLTRHGYFESKGEGLEEGADLFSEQEPVLSTCMAASVQYKIGLGERAGQKIRRLGTMEECFYEEAKLDGSRCATLGGFSLHANTACEPWEREKLERLCRYVARPAIATDRLHQRPDGLLVYKLKTPYRDGTEYLLFSPEEFLEKLAALVPIPRVHLTRFHGVLAPHAKIREKIVTQPSEDNSGQGDPTKKTSCRRRLTWAQLLKRVFKIDAETCGQCGGKMKVIAAILTSSAIESILGHLGLPLTSPAILPARSPPQEAFAF